MQVASTGPGRNATSGGRVETFVFSDRSGTSWSNQDIENHNAHDEQGKVVLVNG
jgi:hypothetical protein